MYKMNYSSLLQELSQSGNLRSIPPVSNDNLHITDFSTNDYLGLAQDAGLREEFYRTRDVSKISMSAVASRLLASDQSEFHQLEELLSSLYNRDTLLFNSGYHANTGLISTLAQGRTLIVADKLVHASIIDGIILSKCRFTRFRHNDFENLEQIVGKNHNDYERIIVAVESIYSMDGDRTDIDRLIQIKKKYPGILLYVDEAHAFGVDGSHGLGLAAESDSAEEIDVIVGTFGKACASMGAFCATSRTIHDYAVNTARSFIFSTALPPIVTAWTRFMIEKIITMDDRRKKLKRLGRQLASGLSEITGRDFEPSHITPLIVGNPVKAVELSHKLSEESYKVLPIRVPTVPPGTDRLRISLSAALEDTDISGFLTALKNVI